MMGRLRATLDWTPGVDRRFQEFVESAKPASHGCFDSAVDLMARWLARIVDPAAPPRLRIERLDNQEARPSTGAGRIGLDGRGRRPGRRDRALRARIAGMVYFRP